MILHWAFDIFDFHRLLWFHVNWQNRLQPLLTYTFDIRLRIYHHIIDTSRDEEATGCWINQQRIRLIVENCLFQQTLNARFPFNFIYFLTNFFVSSSIHLYYLQKHLSFFSAANIFAMLVPICLKIYFDNFLCVLSISDVSNHHGNSHYAAARKSLYTWLGIGTCRNWYLSSWYDRNIPALFDNNHVPTTHLSKNIYVGYIISPGNH